MEETKIKALAKLRTADDDGRPILLAEDVVEAARKPSSPLHEEFTWDDGEAAEQYRLQQARGLIARVTVLWQSDPKTKEMLPVRAYMALRSDGKGYRPTESISQSPPLRASLREQLAADLESVRRKYASFERVLRAPALFKAIDSYVAAVQKQVKRPVKKTAKRAEVRASA